MTKRERFIGIFMIGVILIWLYVALSGDDTMPKVIKPLQPRSITGNKNIKHDRGGGTANAMDLKRLQAKIEAKSKVEQFADLRSPFEAIKRKEKPLVFDIQQLDLMGVIFEHGVPNAIINDTILREGQQIMGCTVERITQNRVTVVHGTDRFILTLHPDARSESETA